MTDSTQDTPQAAEAGLRAFRRSKGELLRQIADLTAGALRPAAQLEVSMLHRQLADLEQVVYPLAQVLVDDGWAVWEIADLAELSLQAVANWPLDTAYSPVRARRQRERREAELRASGPGKVTYRAPGGKRIEQ